MKRWLLLAFALVSIASPHCFAQPQPGATAGAADLATVRNRFVRSVLPPDEAALAEVNRLSAKYAAALQADGSWTDIRYTDAARSTWANADHLNRMLVMAKAARAARNSGHANEALEAKILLALKWWTDHDYRNSNWWWNEIGVPKLTGEVSALMGEQLPPDARGNVVAIMKRSNWAKWTGANLTWGVANQIMRGCLENNAAVVDEGYRRMYEEIKVMPQAEEGIELDGSFHQHGMQLYNGGYGLDFANDVGRFVALSWGTRFQIPADRMAIFSAFLLDGQQWMIRGNVFDYSAVGREITRAGKVAVPQDKSGGPIYPANEATYGLGNVTALLAAEPTPRQKELQAFAARLAGKPGIAELTGNKQFWNSDFMVHRRAGYSTSVRMASTRMRNSELVNSEGRKSVHMSDGANFLYLDGNEYKDIFGVWDWTKIPGTTAIQGMLTTGEKDPIGLRGSTTFDGGVSDGTYGMAAMDLKRGGLTAKKAWFFFDREYVALGAGIALADDATHTVATAVNQPLLKGEVRTSEQSAAVMGAHSYKASHPVWIWHDHVGYIFAPRTKVELTAGPQTGAWSEIGTGSSTPETLPVFNLWIDHGLAPADASYAYTVVPGATSAQVAQLAAHPEVQVLENSVKTQAVYNPALKLAEIAFRAAGAMKTPLGEVKADHSCLLLVRQSAAGWKVTASNPDSEPLTLRVKVQGHETTIALPGGNLAGSSITVVSRVSRTFDLPSYSGRLLVFGCFASGPHGGQKQSGQAMATISASRSICR
jgi:chondroitin AC lyase